ncbi:hypothetical protein RDWZM_008971, partial [Blomia tropicalis]
IITQLAIGRMCKTLRVFDKKRVTLDPLNWPQCMYVSTNVAVRIEGQIELHIRVYTFWLAHEFSGQVALE